MFKKICCTLVHHSSVISLSKKCSWFYTNFHDYKQITCVGSPTVHIFKNTLGSSCIKINRSDIIYIYIYIYIERERDGRENRCIHVFPKCIYTKGKCKQSTPGFELRSLILFSIMITIMPSLGQDICFNGISTLGVYWMLNPVYTYSYYIIYMICKGIVSRQHSF